jgi:hypothetical protein
MMIARDRGRPHGWIEYIEIGASGSGKNATKSGDRAIVGPSFTMAGL